MNEVEKMYRTAKVVPSHHYCNDCKYDMSAECPIRCPDDVAVYPPFTAEKQLNILKIIVHSFGFNSLDKPIWDKGWDIAIAKLVNIYWEVLTEEEKQQVKGILE